MMRAKTTATARALLCFSLGAIGAFMAPEAFAQQSNAPADESAGAPQSLNQGGTSQGQLRTWTYGARGVLSLSSDDSLDPGFGATGFAVYPFYTDFEFEAEAGILFMNTQADGVPKGRLMMFPLRGTIRVQLWRFGPAKPYAGGGAGIYLNSFALDSEIEQQLNQQQIGASASVDLGIALHAAGGVEWESGRWNFGVDVKYLFGETDSQSTIIDQVTGEISRGTGKLSLNGFWVSFGARFSL